MNTTTLLTTILLCLGANAPAAEITLGELGADGFTSGWKTPQINKSVMGLPLKIGTETFAKGIGVHAPSQAMFKLDGKAQAFRAKVGINTDGHAEPGSAEFVVYGDDKLLWRSGIMQGGEAAKAVEVPLAGVRKLQLELTDGGDGLNSDHGDWADPVIVYAGAKPGLFDDKTPFEPATLYPPQDKLIVSPGNTTYFVDPAKGDDANDGKKAKKAWKSIARLNAMKLAPGDQVVIAPGFHAETLKPSGAGTAAKPVVIALAPGRHEFGVEQALRRPYYVSNSCDAPRIPKPIGILMDNVKHFRIQGGGVAGDKKTDIVMMGRMIEILNDHAEDITYTGFTMDLQRPTVSEFRVLDDTPGSTIIQIAEGSEYAIENGKFSWTGDWGSGGGAWCQEVVLEDSRCWRRGMPRGWSTRGQAEATARDLGGRKVELNYGKDAGGLTLGHQYHFRYATRDSVGVHSTRSQDIVFRDCDFYALTNMGFVSQFTENMTFQRVNVAPPAGTIRTCAAWADIFQFSNCKGEMLVENCRLSGMQDDSINCHGTHLRIIEKTGDNQLLLRFMNGQTYGFAVYQPGDEVAVIGHATLREHAGNPRRKVTAVEQKSEKDWLITLDGPAPAFEKDDVIDNITWYPNLTARNNHISVDPVRGFLITTRGKTLVEGNTFLRCAMAGILIEDDAEGWFESGPIRDLTIRNNRFINCGIEINPMSQSAKPEEPVHENIRIENNLFASAGISAHHVKGLAIIGNQTTDAKLPTKLAPTCTDVKIEGTVNSVKNPIGLSWVATRGGIPPAGAGKKAKAAASAKSTGFDQGVAPLPPMGWNSWNDFFVNITDEIVRGQADAIEAMGLKAAGYQYVVIDDGWAKLVNDQWQRDAGGHIVVEATRFPDGMKPVGDYIRGKGLKFGIYTKWYTKGHEAFDVADFLSWGVEYYKYDNFNTDYLDSSWQTMSDILKKTGIVYSIHYAGERYRYRPDIAKVVHLFRTANDIKDTYDVPAYDWATSTTINADRMAEISFATRSGCYADPDMMTIGQGSQNLTEYKSQFALWCLWSAPLIMGHDVRKTTVPILEVLTNPELIAVNQDPAVQPGYRIRYNPQEATEAWVKPLGTTGTQRAVVLHNRGRTPREMSIAWEDLGFVPTEKALVRDLYKRADQGSFAGSYTTTVPAHGVAMLKISGTPPVITSKGKVVYEAEKAFRSEPAAVVAGEGLGGKFKVVGIGGATLDQNGKPIPQNRTGTLTFYVTAAKAGSYPLTLDYLADGDKKLYASINGQAGTAIDCPSTGSWNTGRSVSLTVKLAKGENSIRFYNNEAETVQLDRIMFP
jgi:hypothetical protein